MSESIFRAAKGLVMGALFGLFLLGIFFALLIVLPVIKILNRVLGYEPCRMQWALRGLVGFWLYLLKAFRLLGDGPARGRPMEGPCVLVSNHPGLFDVLFLMRDVPRLSLMVKRSLTSKLPLSPVFRAAGYVLAPDLESTSPLECLDEAMEQIRQGYKFLIFPEATRSPRGDLGSFSAGPFVLARLANVPVQPFFIRNDPPFLPKEERWYFPPCRISHIELEYWDPIAPPEPGRERESARQMQARYKKALGLAEKNEREIGENQNESGRPSPSGLFDPPAGANGAYRLGEGADAERTPGRDHGH